MKHILVAMLVITPSIAFAQIENTNSPYNSNTVTFVKSVRTYGYIQGTRLDSIDTKYARLWGEGSYFYFDFGQLYDKRKEMRLADAEGKYLVFAGAGEIAALNLLYFNGWELVEASPYTQYGKQYLLKRKDIK